ncbi:hypothetical protein [Streptomyces lydicus]|uniref:Uncharacterized protein n=1 Tax=Streptomyces lydicus TaxID=47763 RepID=A0A1D7VNK4_9ACTN|nr:hypothetical protein SL103_20770 [Streptomyces lydicus]
MADPDRALRNALDMLKPGGLFAVVEFAGMPGFLPETAPQDRLGLEERCHAAADRLHAHHVPHRGADWGRRWPRPESPSKASAPSPSTSRVRTARPSAATPTLRRLRHAVASFDLASWRSDIGMGNATSLTKFLGHHCEWD